MKRYSLLLCVLCVSVIGILKIRLKAGDWETMEKGVSKSETEEALSGLQKSRFVNDIKKNYIPNRDLSGVDLSYTDLSYANLSGANLSKANLSGANLNFADLSGADLTDANLTGANLSGVKLKNTTLLYADVQGAKGLTLDTITYLNEQRALNVPLKKK